MPAARPPLTLSQRRHLERRLLEERARVLRTLARTRSDHADDSLGRRPDHMAELGSDTMRETLHAVVASRESDTLVAIDDALRRLYRDPRRFGLCEITGEPIPFARLDLIPWTRRGVGLEGRRPAA